MSKRQFFQGESWTNIHKQEGPPDAAESSGSGAASTVSRTDRAQTPLPTGTPIRVLATPAAAYGVARQWWRKRAEGPSLHQRRSWKFQCGQTSPATLRPCENPAVDRVYKSDAKLATWTVSDSQQPPRTKKRSAWFRERRIVFVRRSIIVTGGLKFGISIVWAVFAVPEFCVNFLRALL